MKNIPSLKLTFSHLKVDGWNTFSFPFGARPIFSGFHSLFVSGSRVCFLDLDVFANVTSFLWMVKSDTFKGWNGDLQRVGI